MKGFDFSDPFDEPDDPPVTYSTPHLARPASSVPPDDPTFSFPPPSVPPPPPRLIPSVPPMAMDAYNAQPDQPPRHLGTIALIATTLTGVAVALVFGGYSLLSAGSTAAWSWKASPPAAVAAAPLDWEQPPAAPAPAVIPPTAPVILPRLQAASDSTVSFASDSLDATLRAAADKCREAEMDPVTVSVTAVFGPEGGVTDARSAAPPEGAEVAGCLARAARTARTAPFDGDAVTVTREITIR